MKISCYLLALLIPFIGSVVSVAADKQKPDPQLAAVQKYIRYGDVDLGQEERTEILDEGLIREVKGWPFQDKLKEHRLFAFQRGWNKQNFTLVAVEKSGLVSEIKDKEGFDRLLISENVQIATADDARDAAQLFLNCYRVTKVLYYNWELGINVVRTVDDIEFDDPKEKVETASQVKIQPPALTKESDGYRYLLYGWDRVGSGGLWRYEILIDRNGVKDYRRTLILGEVGAWRAIQ
jgi:hypothetical protein